MSDAALNRMRKICLALPEAVESEKWGKPHFTVAGKIFAGCGDEDGAFTLGYKLSKVEAAALVKADPSCAPAKYVGKHGWIAQKASAKTDWKKVAERVAKSYRLIAPKPLSALLGP